MQMATQISVKQRMKNGERLNACLIGMFSPVSAEIIAISGYDIGLIDLEHGPGSYIDALSAMQAMSGYPCAPIIRTSSSSIVDIKKTLDIGPAGIMVPNVASVDEAEKIVAGCRYGPEGIRGAATVVIRASGYGNDVESYLEFLNNDFLLIAQIESIKAVEEIEKIASVDGIDMIFIGPLDLSASCGDLGNFTNPVFLEACEKIEDATLGAGKLLGNLAYPEREAEKLYQAGFNLVLSNADVQLLRTAATSDVAAIRKAAKK